MTIKEAFDLTVYTVGEIYDRRESTNISKILFEDVFGIYGVHKKDPFHEDQKQELEECLAKLKEGLPIQYITGRKNFYGYNFKVNKNVLIPRPETEELVSWILSDIQGTSVQYDVLDVGAGSGCIGITLKKKCPNLRMFGVELSLDALNVARINAKKLNAHVEFLRLDILDKNHWDHLGAIDIIVSNPPYVKKSEKDLMSSSTVTFEPEMALFVEDDDPLIFYRSIIEMSHEKLKEKGRVYFEVNEFNAIEVYNLLEENGFQAIEVKQDMQGKERMIKAQI